MKKNCCENCGADALDCECSDPSPNVAEAWYKECSSYLQYIGKDAGYQKLYEKAGKIEELIEKNELEREKRHREYREKSQAELVTNVNKCEVEKIIDARICEECNCRTCDPSKCPK